MAVPLLKGLSRPKRLIADKAYDAMSLRRWLKRRRIKAVIPSLATRTFPFPLDRRAYKRRNVIERMGEGSRTGAVSDTAALLVTTWPVWRQFLS